MSFRTAYRRLRANGSDFGWGARFALTIRIPRDAFTAPYPVPSAELAALLEGYDSTGDLGFGKKFGDGTGARLQLFDPCLSGYHPTSARAGAANRVPYPRVCFRQCVMTHPRDGATRGDDGLVG